MTVHRAGRRRPLPAKSSFKKILKTKKESESVDTQDLEGILTKVQELVDTFRFEEARDLCSRAVLLSPEDADIRYQLGSICLELGDFQGGFENIRLSLNLEPETTPDRFFAFAQLIPGREAVQVYEHGLKVYTEKHSDNTEMEFKRKISTACCAAAEIFMTDLCEDEDAEIQCGNWLDRALEMDPTNPEVYRVVADLRMCQEKPEEARENVLKACSLWNGELTRLMEDGGFEAPSYESRISAAKILIELSMFEETVSVLEQLLREDDSVLMTWYLLGFALKQIPTATAAFEDAIEGALRVSRRDGHLQYPQLLSSDELVQEILGWMHEINLQVDLDAEEEDDGVLDLEEAIREAEEAQNAENAEDN